MTKTGNAYLRYYISEATASAVRNLPEYNDYFNKKFKEVTTHQYKRALALTSRKLVRLNLAHFLDTFKYRVLGKY
ncbi:MAG: hypothetical protein WCS56_01385 [Bacilli bacterium]